MQNITVNVPNVRGGITMVQRRKSTLIQCGKKSAETKRARKVKITLPRLWNDRTEA
jgi:hypothetical protein